MSDDQVMPPIVEIPSKIQSGLTIAQPPAPSQLQTAMSAMAGMGAMAQPGPGLVSPPADVAAFLADMPDMPMIGGEQPQQQQPMAPGSFQPQPPPAPLHAVAQAAAEQEPRASKRRKVEASADADADDDDDEPDNREPAEVIADAAGELGAIADEIEDGDVKRLPELIDAVGEIAGQMSDALSAVLRLQENAMALMAEAAPSGGGGNPLAAMLGMGVGQKPAPVAPSMSQEDASILMQTALVTVSLVRILQAQPKDWERYLRAVTPEMKQVLTGVMQSAPQLVEASAQIIHKLSGFSINDFMQQIPPDQLQQAQRLTGVDITKVPR